MDSTEDTSCDQTDDGESSVSDSVESDFNNSEEDDFLDDPWHRLVECAFERCQSQFDKGVAEYLKRHCFDPDIVREQVFENMKRDFRNEM